MDDDVSLVSTHDADLKERPGGIGADEHDEPVVQ